MVKDIHGFYHRSQREVMLKVELHHESPKVVELKVGLHNRCLVVTKRSAKVIA